VLKLAIGAWTMGTAMPKRSRSLRSGQPMIVSEPEAVGLTPKNAGRQTVSRNSRGAFSMSAGVTGGVVPAEFFAPVFFCRQARVRSAVQQAGTAADAASDG
jgi:hypothetical protein